VLAADQDLQNDGLFAGIPPLLNVDAEIRKSAN
jgi:hypothetical protein